MNSRNKQSIYGLIPNEWILSSVLEISEMVTDYVSNGSFASLKKGVKYLDTPSDAVLIRLVDFNNGFSGPFVFIDNNSYEFLKKTKLYGNEIIISNVGANVGTVFKCPKLDSKMSLGPNAILVKLIGYNDYFYYWFKSEFGQYALKSIVTGSAQPKFNKTDFRKLIIPIPSLSEQKAIASILSTLDDKIQLNNKINRTLEEMAQAIFKSWFVDFEPFKDGEFVESEIGLIPINWKIESLDNSINFINGLPMQNFRAKNDSFLPVIKIRELNQGFHDSSSDRCLVEIPEKSVINNGDIVFSWSGTLLVKFWNGGKCGLNQHLFKVESKVLSSALIYLWTKHHLPNFQGIAKDKATTMGHINRHHLSQAKILVPPENLIEKFNFLVEPIFKQLCNLELQSRKLGELRELLLPKLMSGEIRILTKEV